MADASQGSSDPQVTFKVKTAGDSSHEVTMPESATVQDLKNRLAGSDYENIPIERQRLIYSGRVMKNEEPLSTYKIKSGNTVHLVKSAASNPAPTPSASSSSSAAPAAPQIPQNMAAGTANNPLAGLTGARYAGLTNLPSADMFGPDGGMVGSPMDEDQVANMLNNPHVAQQMNEMLNNDQFLEMMIQGNPMLRNNPNAREMLRSPMFRHMMTNPDTLRAAARMQRMMRPGGGGSFPAPGVTDTTPADAASEANSSADSAVSDASNPANLIAMLNPFGVPPSGAGASGDAAAGGGPGATANAGQNSGTANSSSPVPNPFASLFGGAPGANAGAAANPFGGGMPAMSPEALQQMLQLMGMGAPGGSAPPADNRPPEERYAEQLRQLNDMGFYDFDRNVTALRRSGGSVQGAVEYLLSG